MTEWFRRGMIGMVFHRLRSSRSTDGCYHRIRSRTIVIIVMTYNFGIIGLYRIHALIVNIINGWYCLWCRCGGGGRCHGEILLGGMHRGGTRMMMKL